MWMRKAGAVAAAVVVDVVVPRRTRRLLAFMRIHKPSIA
jgi:hypothetical protein